MLTIKVLRKDAGLCGLPDPFGREFVYYASSKQFQNGARCVGDTPREAVEKLFDAMEAK